MINFVLLLYLITLICCFVVLSKSSFNIKFGLVLLLLFLITIIVAFRSNEYVPDVISYEYYFDNIKWEHIYNSLFYGKESFCRIENGFLLYTLLFRDCICNNTICYFASICILQMFLIYKALNKCLKNNLKKTICAFAFILPYFGLFYSLVTIRSGLAFCVAINAFVKPYNKISDFIIKLIIYGFAYSIHHSSIIVLFIELLSYFLIISSKKIKSFIPLFFIFSLSLKNSFFQKLVMDLFAKIFDYFAYGKVLRYLLTYEFRITWGLRDLCFYFLGIVFLIFRKYVRNEYYDKLLLVFITGLYISNLLSGVKIAYRLTDIFWLFTPFMMSELYTNEKLIRKHKYALSIFSIIYTIMGVTLFIRVTHYWERIANQW